MLWALRSDSAHNGCLHFEVSEEVLDVVLRYPVDDVQLRCEFEQVLQLLDVEVHELPVELAHEQVEALLVLELDVLPRLLEIVLGEPHDDLVQDVNLPAALVEIKVRVLVDLRELRAVVSVRSCRGRNEGGRG